MFRSLTILSLAALAAPAQTVSRFYSYTVEETAISNDHGLIDFNNRGSLLMVSPSVTRLLRLADGTVVTFPLLFAAGDVNNYDQVLGGGTIWAAGTYTVCDYYGDRDPLLSAFGYHLGDSGQFVSTQRWYLTGGLVRWVSAQHCAIGSAQGTTLLPLHGLPSGLAQHMGTGPNDPIQATAFGPINVRGEFLVNGSWPTGSPVPPFYNSGVFRSVGGTCSQVILPTGHAAVGISDDGLVWGYRQADGGTFVQRSDGVVEHLAAAALEQSVPNRWFAQVGRPRGAGSTGRHRIALRSGAFAALDTLLLQGVQYSALGITAFGGTTPGRINDTHQVAIPAVRSGQGRWLILHPSVTPVLALEFSAGVRSGNGRYEVQRQSDGRTPVRIVGGEPGQPNAMFLKLGAQYHYIDGTLGFFDNVQTFQFRLPVPTNLIGLDFDVGAGALDNQFGILRSLDVPITFR